MTAKPNAAPPKELAENDLAKWQRRHPRHAAGRRSRTGTVTVTDRAEPESDNYVISVTWREANSDIDYSYTVSMNIANPIGEAP